MKDKKFTILCIILMILLAGFAVYMALQQQQQPDKTPVGSYCSEGKFPTENICFSLYNDQKFVLFHQYDLRYTGKYAEETDGKNLRLLLTCEDGTTATAMFDRRGQVFLDGSSLPGMPEKILAFGRISDVPGDVAFPSKQE